MRTPQLMQACHDRLNDPSLTGLLSQNYGVPAVFQVGRVPRRDGGEPIAFPYVTFGVPSDADWSDKGALGGSAVVQVDVWDRSGSMLALGLIMRAATLATVRQPWQLPGFVTCERENSDVVDDPDGLTKHGMIRLRVFYID